jgi:hypothetical protein
VWPGSVGVEDTGRIFTLNEDVLSKDTQAQLLFSRYRSGC